MICKHRQYWVIAGGWWLWCYQCGAIRPMRRTTPTISEPAGGWTRPTGPGGENPACLTPGKGNGQGRRKGSR